MKPLSRRIYAISAIVLAAVIFVGANIAIDATFTTNRVDLTDNGLFTLSRGTRNIIASLKEPITLKFFYSKKVAAEYAQTRAYADRVRDLLQEYAALSHGKIILEEIDPAPYTPAEDEATADGLTGAPTDSGDVVYFGLYGTNSIDGSAVIPYFSPDRENFLEYDLSSLVYRLSTPKKPKLAVISTLPLDTGFGGMQAMVQGTSRPLTIYQQLSQTYDTNMLGQNFTSIPPGTDVLMIAQPGPLNDRQNYAIDQFVMKGGRVLAFVDPNSELAAAGNANQGMRGPSSSSLPRLFQAWGVGYNINKEIGDLDLAQQVQTSGDPRNPVTAYPVWLHLTRDQFDAHDPITANLQVLNLASVGSLHRRKDATTHFSPLVVSSHKAALLDTEEVRLIQRPGDLMSSITPTGQQYVIAARISGPAKTAFPDGPPAGAGQAQVKSAKDINVVVMADTDIFDDRFWVRVGNLYGRQVDAPFADNGAFVENAVENLTGSADLISLRTRATNNRPFTVVQNLQAQAQAEYQQEAQSLQQRLTDTQERLHDLQQGQGDHGANIAMTPKQQVEIDRFKRELIETRSELRDVQHSLRKDIDALGEFLAFMNIALVPLLVACFAFVLAWVRRRRRARAIPM
ncbi:MAG: Gldg family protein [Alphaproteobacteria bacterium]|nr:Gldg family protein [Alphaproteobacteria bacterium]MDE2110931.1 Gldg family protein [Alphaproteobacteria bacterium]